MYVMCIFGVLYWNGECMYIEFKDLNCVFVNVEINMYGFFLDGFD